MRYTYTESLRSKTLYTDLLIKCEGTSSTLQTPKGYAVSSVCAVNGESASDFYSKDYQELDVSDGTGWSVDGSCDVNLILLYTGTNKAIAPIFQIIMKDTKCNDTDDFKTYLLAALGRYYPAIGSLAQIKIKSAIFTFHE